MADFTFLWSDFLKHKQIDLKKKSVTWFKDGTERNRWIIPKDRGFRYFSKEYTSFKNYMPIECYPGY